MEASRLLAAPGPLEKRAADLAAVFLRRAGAALAVIELLDQSEDRATIVAYAGPASLAFYKAGELGRHRPSEEALRTRSPVFINGLSPNEKASIAWAGLRVESAAFLPVIAADRILALVSLGALEKDHFEEHRVRLLSAIAEGVGVFLGDTRWQDEERQRAARIKERYDALVLRLLGYVQTQERIRSLTAEAEILSDRRGRVVDMLQSVQSLSQELENELKLSLTDS